MKTTNLYSLACVFLGIILFAGCQREALTPETSATGVSDLAQRRLSEQLNDYEAVVYDHTEMYKSLSHLPEGAAARVVFPLQRAAGPVVLHLTRNSVVADDVVGTLWDGKRATTTGPLGIRTFEGTVEGGGAAALTLSPTTIEGFMDIDGETMVLEPIQKFDPTRSGTAIVYREQGMNARAAEAYCSEMAPPPGSSTLRTAPGGGGGSLAPASCFTVEMMAHGDYQYLQYYGLNYNTALSSLASAVNNASARLTTAKIKLTVSSSNLILNTAPDAYSYDASILLSNIRFADNQAFPSKVRDLTVFVTGRDMTMNGSNSVAGIAWPNVVCANSSYSYCVAECFQGVYNTRILSHEVLHTLGASHDNNCTQNLMYASYNSSCAGNYPSATSISQVATYTNTNNACLVWGGC